MMQSRRSAGAVMFFILLFILQSASQLAINHSPNPETIDEGAQVERVHFNLRDGVFNDCLLYTSPSPRDCLLSRMPSSA